MLPSNSWLYFTRNIWRFSFPFFLFYFLNFREELKLNDFKIGNINKPTAGRRSLMEKSSSQGWFGFFVLIECSTMTWRSYRFHSNSCALCLFAGEMEEALAIPSKTFNEVMCGSRNHCGWNEKRFSTVTASRKNHENFMNELVVNEIKSTATWEEEKEISHRY